jgi:DNA-directed RNA polymerase subunit beta'
MKEENHKDVNNFDTMTIQLASPDRIKSWSHGEVTKAETINYRTQRSEKNGLFDEKTFGPEKDFECYCGKYRGIRYKGIVCEKCGVELTRAIVRRERMGHIELATPVSHIWFLRSMPSRIGLLMGINTGELEKVIYFAGYIITNVIEEERTDILKELDSEYKSKVKQLEDDEARDALKQKFLDTKKEIEGIQKGRVIDEVGYHNYSMKYGTLFEAGIGAESIYEIFKNLDLAKHQEAIEARIEKAGSAELPKLNKRLSLVKAMIVSGTRPEWMFLTRIPVIPPAIRPMVPLDGGRYATSDVNDLYRRVINRNNRLKKLKDIFAPDVILRNEKRILQEAVDALIDNSIRHGNASAGAATGSRRQLKSLADNLKGKRGILRGNLLGKRVDYSGRSVIVVGPTLKLHECGLPKHMALELFKPFVISGLLQQELAFNIRGANKLIDEEIPEVWSILEDVIEDKYVLLNRAPTLHRLGIQAFKPQLIEGDAVQVHPLVCSAFNADFDGDQMAVHVPLSKAAQIEAREIMASDKNILKPGSGKPIVSAKLLDIVLGCYWMTKEMKGEKGEGKYFDSPNAAINAFNFEVVSFRAPIKVMATATAKYDRFESGIFDTTVGRLLFNSVLPKDYPFINDEISGKRMATMIDDLIEKYGIESIPAILDKIKAFGFEYATQSGITWGIDDVVIPEGKKAIIEAAKVESANVMDQFNMGFLSKEERLQKNIEIWHGAKGKIEELIPATLDPNGSVHDMVYSGARGSFSQITQMAGMKGLIQATSGETIEFPILSCSKEGLTPIEYFITTHGSRKGLTDTALNTAKAGYLTRRLFDVSQDVIIREEDCKTKLGIAITNETHSGIEVSIAKHIKGRFLGKNVVDPEGNTLFKKGDLLNKYDGLKIEEAGVSEVIVRSPMTCETINGVCVKCYGTDLGNNRIINLGEAIGTVAAQAIGEPGTQLTMRTFHAGGTASVGGDITQGLPRVEEIFEKRKPKNAAVVSRINGLVSDIQITPKEKIITITPEGSNKKVKASDTEYSMSLYRTILVKVGDEVAEGQLLTDGSADLEEVFKYAGKEATAEYIIHEISKLYELQGESVSRKHIEVIIKQMFSRFKVSNAGDTSFAKGDIVEWHDFVTENEKTEGEGGLPAEVESVIKGITEVALSRKSFLSAASFQHTTRVLINAAVRGTKDKLVGLKENVILGRMIPAGTGFPGSQKQKMIEEKLAEAE